MFKNSWKINKVVCVLKDVFTENNFQENNSQLPSQLPDLAELKRLAGLNRTFVQQLQFEPVTKYLERWLQTLRPNTQRNYRYYVSNMIRRGILHVKEPKSGRDISIGEFNNLPHEVMLDHIKKVKDWSPSTQQGRAACYISFSKYLERISRGAFRAVKPSTLKSNPTYFKVREKCATNALKLNEWHTFIEALEKISKREALIARCLLQGAKRVSEALNLKEEDVDWENGIIKFRQSKTASGFEKIIHITYPKEFMENLKAYLEQTRNLRGNNSWLFLTRNGTKVDRRWVLEIFVRASKRAGMPKVTPHVLRATWVTIMKKQGISDSDIMKVTGHASADRVMQYDKSDSEDNITRKISLI